MSSGNKSMSFIDHLEELRWRIIKILSSIIFGGILTFSLLTFFRTSLKPLDNTNSDNPINLQVLSVQGMFIIKWSIALIGGVVLAIPVITFQIWKFISPGLYANEKGFVLPLVFFSFVSFLLGIIFSYTILIPYCLNFFASLSGERLF